MFLAFFPWAVLSDEQMSNGWSYSYFLPNDKQALASFMLYKNALEPAHGEQVIQDVQISVW